jgi:hypothetical protein
MKTSLLTSPTVAQIAEAYAGEFANLRRERAEKKYLTPLGLSTSTFLNNQTNLAPALAQKLMEQLSSEDLDSAAIVTGVDQLGAHIFVVDDPGEAVCYDLDGWAAIGSGWRHADLQFISDKYNTNCPFDEAFLLVYLAKKKADITPGVGTSTDLFWIVDGPNGYVLFLPEAEIVQLVQRLHDLKRRLNSSGRKLERRLRSLLRMPSQNPHSRQRVKSNSKKARGNQMEPLTRKAFQEALRKVSRRVSPSTPDRSSRRTSD